MTNEAVLRMYLEALPTDFLIGMANLAEHKWTPRSYAGCLRAQVVYMAQRKMSPAEILAGTEQDQAARMHQHDPLRDTRWDGETIDAISMPMYKDIIEHEHRILEETGENVPECFDDLAKDHGDSFGSFMRQLCADELASRQVVFNAEGGDVHEPSPQTEKEPCHASPTQIVTS